MGGLALSCAGYANIINVFQSIRIFKKLEHQIEGSLSGLTLKFVIYPSAFVKYFTIFFTLEEFPLEETTRHLSGV